MQNRKTMEGKTQSGKCMVMKWIEQRWGGGCRKKWDNGRKKKEWDDERRLMVSWPRKEERWGEGGISGKVRKARWERWRNERWGLQRGEAQRVVEDETVREGESPGMWSVRWGMRWWGMRWLGKAGMRLVEAVMKWVKEAGMKWVNAVGMEWVISGCATRMKQVGDLLYTEVTWGREKRETRIRRGGDER